MTISSETSAPLSIAAFAFSPYSVPFFTASRSMLPVEICGMDNASEMTSA